MFELAYLDNNWAREMQLALHDETQLNKNSGIIFVIVRDIVH